MILEIFNMIKSFNVVRPLSKRSDHHFSLKSKVAIVTGGSGDIGHDIVVELARAGAKTIVLGRNENKLQRTVNDVSSFGIRSLSMRCDIRNIDQVRSSIDYGLRMFGRIDILVNNAAIGCPGSIETITEQAWDDVLDTNLKSMFLFCKTLSPVFRKQHYGRIINIASISAQTGGIAGGVAYTASKGGVISFTKTLSRDMARCGVTVNAISPGVIDAGFGRLKKLERKQYERIIPLGRVGTGRDIAYAVVFLASDEAEYITGATLDVNGGLLKR